MSRLNDVGRLAAGLAHDFNNTLQVINGYNDLISIEAGASESVRDSTEQIRLAASRADVIVRQLLTMGQATTRPRDCTDLNAALAEAESSLRQHLRPGQALVLSLEAVDPRVGIAPHAGGPGGSQPRPERPGCDAGRRDHHDHDEHAQPGSPDHRGSAAGAPGSVLLEVRDTGTGMDDATLRRVFEPFFTTKTPDKGTGLGLSTVQLIVEAAGGSLHAESTPGEGTLFSIVLPSAAGAESLGGHGRPNRKQEVHHESAEHMVIAMADVHGDERRDGCFRAGCRPGGQVTFPTRWPRMRRTSW